MKKCEKMTKIIYYRWGPKMGLDLAIGPATSWPDPNIVSEKLVQFESEIWEFLSGICVEATCPMSSELRMTGPQTANLAVIAAIFVGVILTITIIVAAAIGYFGLILTVLWTYETLVDRPQIMLKVFARLL